MDLYRLSGTTGDLEPLDLDNVFNNCKSQRSLTLAKLRSSILIHTCKSLLIHLIYFDPRNPS